MQVLPEPRVIYIIPLLGKMTTVCALICGETPGVRSGK